MLGKQRRRRAEALAELQAEVEAQAALAVVAEHAEAGRRAQTDRRAQLGWAPPQMWSHTPEVPPEPAPAPAPAMVEIPAELLRVLDAVTSMCDHVIEYIEADRAERPLMVEALTRLNLSLAERPVAVAVEPNGNANGHGALEERVIGGSMLAGPEPVVDLRREETAVEVRCRFGDRWVDGFEICEVLHDEFGIRYRLLRRVDGVILPDLFDAADIRHIETFEELTSRATPPRHWSPL